MEERVLLQSNCSLYRVTTKEELDTFSCGDKDLDDFFHREACLYDGQLLGKTYFFATERSGKDEIVCAFTLANDSIKAALIPNASRNRIQRKIPNSKRTKSSKLISKTVLAHLRPLMTELCVLLDLR